MGEKPASLAYFWMVKAESAEGLQFFRVGAASEAQAIAMVEAAYPQCKNFLAERMDNSGDIAAGDIIPFIDDETHAAIPEWP